MHGNKCDIAIAQIVILIETIRVCFTMILMFGVLAVGISFAFKHSVIIDL